jgi:hypothetical protein
VSADADLAHHRVEPARGEDHGQADGPRDEGRVAQSVRLGDSGRRFGDRGRQLVGASPGTGAPHFRARIDFLKDDVFEICGALALAETLLHRLGRHEEAAHLGEVFDVVEGRLATALPRYEGLAPGSSS